MNRFFSEWDWEDTWQMLLYAVVTFFIGLLLFAITQDHKVRYYYLDGAEGSNEVQIKGDINWAQDVNIKIDRTITYEQAINLVDSLNHTLVK